jgi:hypothetical protein
MFDDTARRERLAKKDYVAEALRWFARFHPDTGRWHPAFRSESEVPDYLTPDEQHRAITEAITEHEGNEEALSQLRAALDAPEPTTDGTTQEGESVTDDRLAVKRLTRGDHDRLGDLCGGFEDRVGRHPPEFTDSEQDQRIRSILDTPGILIEIVEPVAETLDVTPAEEAA